MSMIPPWRARRRRMAALAVLAAALPWLSGCGGASVSVPPVLPVPLVDRLPLTMGVYLSEELVSYVHEETIPESGDWRIDLGSAQTVMFDNLLGGLFEATAPVADPTAPNGVDGVLVPEIEEVQFSTPDQTRSDYFEVWVRYRFRLHDRDGSAVGEFDLTAYGKADAGNYGLNNRSPALQAAALAALRDAMAFFTVKFQREPPVQTWLRAELGGVS